jgi:hypothetical protein
VIVLILYGVQALEVVHLRAKAPVTLATSTYRLQLQLELAACVLAFAQTLVVQLTWASPDPQVQLAATCVAAAAIVFAQST